MRQSTQRNAPHVLAVTFEGGVNDPRVLSSDPIIDPSSVGLAEVEGSIYLDPTATAGKAFLKEGAANTAWTLLSTSVGVTDHTALSNIGVDTHPTIDTHIDIFTATAVGDIWYSNGTTAIKLLAGAEAKVLTAHGAAAPTWEDAAGGIANLQEGYAANPLINITPGTPLDLAIDGGAALFDAGLLLSNETPATSDANVEYAPTLRTMSSLWNGSIPVSAELEQRTTFTRTGSTVHAGLNILNRIAGGAWDTVLFVLPETAKTRIQTRSTNYWAFGDVSTGHGAEITDNADIAVNGIDCKEVLFVDGYAQLKDNSELRFGFPPHAALDWSTADASNNVLVWGFDDTSKSIVFCDYTDRASDWGSTMGLAAFSNPTTIWASAAATNWGGWQCDGTDLVSVHDSTTGLRAGAAFKRTTTDGITASTTQTQAGGTALTSDFNIIDTVANDDDAVTMPLATAGATVRIVNDGANRLQIFPGVGDDVGNGVDASIAICSTAVATFIARDGTTWTLMSEVNGPLGHMHQGRNTTAFVVNATNQHHCYHSASISAPHLEGWAFDAGSAGSPLSISSIADGGGGEIDITTSAAHSLATGAIVSVTNTGDSNYDIVHVVTGIVDADTFSVVATFTATGTGTVDEAATLECLPGSAGDYHVEWAVSANPAGSNETFDFLLYVDAAEQVTSEARRKLGTGGDFGLGSWPDILTFAEGDKVSWVLQNTSSAGNVTARHFTVLLNRTRR